VKGVYDPAIKTNDKSPTHKFAMEPFDKLFVHCPEYKVIICRRCKFAIIPTQVEGHIKAKHGATINRSQARAIADTVSHMLDVAWTPEEVLYPDPGVRPIEWIPVTENGRRCIAKREGKACNYVCCHRTGIQQHCEKEHGWKNPRKPGRRSKKPAVEETGQLWKDNQPCQIFFKTGKWQRYFAVATRPATVQIIDSNTGHKEGYLEKLLEWVEDGRKQEMSERRRCEASPWLTHTGWEEHIGVHKEWAVRMIQPLIEGREESGSQIRQTRVETVDTCPSQEMGQPDEAGNERSEEALRRACAATSILIRRSFKISQVDIVGRAAMEYINRREAGATNNDRPFYGKQKVQTIRRYTDKFIKILRYIWRTEHMEDRPKYRLTRTQQARLQDYRHEAAKTNGQKDESVKVALEFWIAMFDHKLGDREFDSAILSGLAVLGADSDNGGWMPAINYTPTLAAIITTMRAMVIRRAWYERRQHISEQSAAGTPEDEAREGAPSVFDGVKAAVHQFMTLTIFGSQPTPLNTVYTQKTYGMKIRYTTKAEGQISWEGDETVLCRKIKFNMSDIRTVVHGLLSTARQRLVGELLMLPVVERSSAKEWRPIGLPRFELKQIADNHSIMDEGWSFFADVRNEWAVNGATWMGQRALHEPEMEARFINVNEGSGDGPAAIDWNKDAVADYLRAVTKFKEELMVLVHMSAGAPARSTELTSIQRVNGQNARSQRGVFVDNGLVAFVTTYHKGYSASQSMKNVHRFVPREVGEIVIYYLWLVEPFERIVQAGANGQQSYSSWLWEPAPEEDWPDEDVEHLDEGYDSERETFAATIGQPGEDVVDEEENEEGMEEDESVATNRPRQKARNCDGYWTTDRTRRVMQRETERRIGVRIGISDWRQVYPAIHREFTTDKETRGALDRIYDNRQAAPDPVADDNIAIIRAQQSGHSFQMEEDIYGRSTQQSPFTTIAEKEMFRRVSRDWHRFLWFPSAWSEESADPDVRRRVKQEREDARFRQFEQMRAMNPLAELRRFYNNPNAEFRGLQGEALEVITQGHPRVVVVMRTGGGKSLLFMLPAFASKGGLTIVVVPKRALQANMKQRCIDGGIKCAVWSEGRAPPYDVRILFAIAESAVTKTFADYINSRSSTQRLERIVIDECHTIMQSTDTWRPNVRELRTLAGRSTQVVCLTATLPPTKQAEFMSAMDLDEKEVAMLREATTRPNIAYSIRNHDAEEGDGAVHALVEEKKAQYPSEDKIVIYCTSIKRVKHLASTFGYTGFWRAVGTEEEKADIVAQLSQSNERVFVTTNALGEGIDAPSIRVVIHDGIIDSLDDYGQQSGRAGRDGDTASEAIILRKVHVDRWGKRRVDAGPRTEPAMRKFVSGDVCRRRVMDTYMDGDVGEPRTTCRVGEQFCDVCRGQGTKRVRVVVTEGEDGRSIKRVRRETQWRRETQARDAEEERRGRERQQKEEDGLVAEANKVAEEGRRAEFERRARQFQAIEARQREERIRQGEVMEKLEHHLKGWKHGCSICRIRGRVEDRRHDWKQCQRGGTDRTAMNSVKDALIKVQWTDGRSCCRQCWAPQMLCHSFERIDDSGRARFRQKAGASACQFRGVMYEAVAAILAIGGAEVMEWVLREVETSSDVDEARQDDRRDVCMEWLGSRVVKGGAEMSGMSWMFYSWASFVRQEA